MAYEGSALSRTVKRGVENLPSVSYTMLSGGTVRVYPDNLGVECTHRRNGSDRTERMFITVNTRWGFA